MANASSAATLVAEELILLKRQRYPFALIDDYVYQTREETAELT